MKKWCSLLFPPIEQTIFWFLLRFFFAWASACGLKQGHPHSVRGMCVFFSLSK